MEPLQLTTYQKALQINLDAAKYGTFAEIGAGQEVERGFTDAAMFRADGEVVQPPTTM